MATKVGDNEQCPCGSGRKYSECHIGLFSTQHWKAIRTNEALSEILNSSKELKTVTPQFLRE